MRTECTRWRRIRARMENIIVKEHRRPTAEEEDSEESEKWKLLILRRASPQKEEGRVEEMSTLCRVHKLGLGSLIDRGRQDLTISSLSLLRNLISQA